MDVEHLTLDLLKDRSRAGLERLLLKKFVTCMPALNQS
jgi:hypothetical protein